MAPPLANVMKTHVFLDHFKAQTKHKLNALAATGRCPMAWRDINTGAVS